MNAQEALWAGTFGDAYLKRNQVDWHLRRPFWQKIAKTTHARSALELGCNAGWNLRCLRGAGVHSVAGIDINAAAVTQAREQGVFAVAGDARMAGWLGPVFDLVLTCGMLIHVAPEDLQSTLGSALSATKQWFLAVEYESEEQEEIVYRGHKQALWKRPYGRLLDAFGVQVLQSGKLGAEDGFDDVTWWLGVRG